MARVRRVLVEIPNHGEQPWEVAVRFPLAWRCTTRRKSMANRWDLRTYGRRSNSSGGSYHLSAFPLTSRFTFVKPFRAELRLKQNGRAWSDVTRRSTQS